VKLDKGTLSLQAGSQFHQCSARKKENVMRIAFNLLLAIILWFGSQSGFAQSTLISGQVVKVDEAANKITIKHGPIPKLDMDEGMTMVFAAPDPNMLKAVKAGDKVNFDAERVRGQLTITKIEKAK
jgi:Cu/Ag efflux protein CusF